MADGRRYSYRDMHIPYIQGYAVMSLRYDWPLKHKNQVVADFGALSCSGMTPESLPPSIYDNSPIHVTGCHQSVEWIDKAAKTISPLVLQDRKGRIMDRRLGGGDRTQIPLEDFQGRCKVYSDDGIMGVSN